MRVINLAVTCAVVALVAGSQLSRLPADRRADLLSTVSGFVGAAPAPRPVAVATTPALVPVQQMRPEPARFGGPSETIAPGPYGQFETAIEIDGQRIGAMVDTGASFLALSFDDADRLGIRPLPSDYRIPMSTANGRAYVAQVRLPTVRLGSITVHDVTAIVAQRGQMSGNLLGMSFLSHLSSMKVDRGRLLLEQ